MDAQHYMACESVIERERDKTQRGMERKEIRKKGQ